MNLSDLGSIVGSIQSIISIIAIIVAGTWSYMLFISKRERWPRASIVQKTSVYKVNDDYIIVSLDIDFTNSSKILLSLSSYEIYLKQMLPSSSELQRKLSNAESFEKGIEIIEWEVLALHKEKPYSANHFYEIEPGETHQFHFNFLIKASVEIFIVESNFYNITKRKKQLGWQRITTHNLSKEREVKCLNSSLDKDATKESA